MIYIGIFLRYCARTHWR